MLVTYCRPKRLVEADRWSFDQIDAFWIECTRREAEQLVLPRVADGHRACVEASVAEACRLLERAPPDGKRLLRDHHDRRLQRWVGIGFLVSADLTAIAGGPIHHPYAGLWNAYSPFDEIVPVEISNLDQLSTIQIVVARPLGLRDPARHQHGRETCES